MSDARQSTGSGGGRNALRLAALLGFIALGVVGCVLIESIFERPTTPEPTGPASTGSQLPVPTTSAPASSTPPSSAPPPAGRVIIGDYRCLTLERATERVTADGFTVGSVNYTLSGGAVDDTWVIERQTPEPGTFATPGSAIDLILSNPFFVCPTPAPEP